MTKVQVAVRLPREQVKRVDRLVGVTHTSRSEVIRRALDLYLYRLACERDARVYEETPLTEAELSMSDDAGAWKATPKW